ncbi:unnamed protein product [Tilletia controversa]|uniref:Uncharacterized protein n=2 Tax=Tilletia TaxID=13289 RepID=A0A177V658_9BASI|nr:hypothetical protein CF336_g6165 [Tilletia laevis]KAE8256170.1 hypothetical protein A4X03_0g5456 [Tilletia caries]CAD6961775.1 unnamed protein product [Tilletia controversa]CAD6884413.1 unnamed protein product [Tilletia caries]CAD6901607.1 unnamed protein product [Tilletia caries]
MRPMQHSLYAATALLLALASLQVQVQAQAVGDVATSTDANGDLYTGTVAADGTVPAYTPVAADAGSDDFVPVGAAGGGGGVITTQATLQTISGYTPPRLGAIPTPVPIAGTIVQPNAIPGYTNAANQQSSSESSASGPTLNSLVERHFPLILSAVAAVLGGALVVL